MTFEGYGVAYDPYVYKGTQCLKNRLGLRDPSQLADFEVEISTLRAEEPLPQGRFSPRHYRRIHWHLFRDVYRWAGHYRTIRTGKGSNWFCYPEHIPREMNKLFPRLRAPEFRLGVTERAFLDSVTEFLADLNAIHPFRDGNGRTQLAFVDLLAFHAQWPLDFSKIRQETFISAMIESFGGSTASLRRELMALRGVVTRT